MRLWKSIGKQSDADLTDQNPRLIVGLGNPGRIYEKNRHNIGFMCLDHYAKIHGLSFGQKRARALIATGNLFGVPVILAKPQTYMNLSGHAVREIVRWHKIPLENVLIVYDDMDLPFGTIRIREKGSAGGHNGLKSIIQELGTNEIPRLRVGIGHPGEREAVSHVLNNFNSAERKVLSNVIDLVSEAVDTAIKEGIVPAMNTFNGKGVGPV